MNKFWIRMLFGKQRKTGNVSYHYSDKHYNVYHVGVLRSILIDTFSKKHNWASHPIARLLE